MTAPTRPQKWYTVRRIDYEEDGMFIQVDDVEDYETEQEARNAFPTAEQCSTDPWLLEHSKGSVFQLIVQQVLDEREVK